MGEEMVSVQADVLESVTDQLASALSCECKTEEVLRTGAADEIAADGPVWTKEKFDSMYRRIMRLCDGDIQGQRHMFLHLATWVQESLTDALSRAEAAEAERDALRARYEPPPEMPYLHWVGKCLWFGVRGAYGGHECYGWLGVGLESSSWRPSAIDADWSDYDSPEAARAALWNAACQRYGLADDGVTPVSANKDVTEG